MLQVQLKLHAGPLTSLIFLFVQNSLVNLFLACNGFSPWDQVRLLPVWNLQYFSEKAGDLSIRAPVTLVFPVSSSIILSLQNAGSSTLVVMYPQRRIHVSSGLGFLVSLLVLIYDLGLFGKKKKRQTTICFLGFHVIILILVSRQHPANKIIFPIMCLQFCVFLYHVLGFVLSNL